ncbi:DUF4179 domain-containing protein [Paenisporosarcina cavernae]|uniref:DUF4179 domain-containing protein n=1 Tax=Paenisporosarcina cavernae TaxID=2320858 RepID=A0A385YUW0_9BACL|nr:DUF4179 domain-containing protein [Paenisporosarcina cavernae]AYC30070.1 DUF4179 domain-containing protein [Paenisporosarcina cavernae]
MSIKESVYMEKLRDELDQQSVPEDQLYSSVMKGYMRAKAERKIRVKQSRKVSVVLIAAVALLLVLLSLSDQTLRPVQLLQKVPGLEWVWKNDSLQGMELNISESSAYQRVDKSQTVDGMTFTIDGIIVDQTTIALDYHLALPSDSVGLGGDTFLFTVDDKFVVTEQSWGNFQENGNGKKVDDTYVAIVRDPIDMDAKELNVSYSVTLNAKNYAFTLPIEIEKVADVTKYATKKTSFELDGQSFSVKRVVVHPGITSIEIEEDKNNTYKVLRFLDLRLEDSNGHQSLPVKNGIISTDAENGNKVYYVQSNILNESEELSLKLNRVEALPKDKAFITIDTEKKTLQNPMEDGMLSLGKVTPTEIEVIYYMDSVSSNLLGNVEDANGKAIPTSYSESSDGREMIKLDTSNYENPLRISLISYPNEMEKAIRIPLKLE